MGHLNVTKLVHSKDKAQYISHLIDDLNALDKMLEDDLIEKTPIRIGAEQEFCLVNDDFLPTYNSLDVLETIGDEHFTTEIGRYNLEINSDPLELKTDCFSQLHKNLLQLLAKARKGAEKHHTKVVLTGILPTLSLKHISESYMTDMPRYKILNEALKASRKQDFSIHIKGVDEINLLHDSVMLEACNTSFQTHLQINPDEFIERFNWAQAIAGPVLSMCTNSPVLFGKELWAETRIALFTQSVDTRANSFMLNEKQSRVSFGTDWEKGNVTDIFRDNISRFRSLLTATFENNSLDQLKQDQIPKLKALNLHNGTVYKWNRVCYGVGNGKPHIRIECRYIPAGPTVIDEIANMMFWVGLMLSRTEKYRDIHSKMQFKDVKSNFFKAARYGMETQFNWMGAIVPAKDLILDELLPLAYKGLHQANISHKDAERYLSVIERRVKSQNGSQWLTEGYRNLNTKKKPFEALQTLTSYMYKKQIADFPVDSWTKVKLNETPNFNTQLTVKHRMNTKIFSVDESDSLDLVYNMMLWKNINHMPVINSKKEIVGLLSSKDITLKDKDNLSKSVKSIMKTTIITIEQDDLLETAKQTMINHNINSLPVINNDTLVGIITSKDL
ncbi:MAG: CBS domain-containing protein [Winogradskyella sp.]|nr:CBS domain-containing protein [Winogradskyella sp.]NNF85276.1 CBS domain-containing protein [Winogradskyella sp.]